MGDKVLNFPLIAISDGIISYLQYVFGSADISPSEYRWNADDRQTRIFIGAPYTITRDKVSDYPSITVARGAFRFQNQFINNFESADANSFENPQYRDLIEGPLSIICEAGAGPEATGLAQFVAVLLQSNRHAVTGALGYVHKYTWVGISGEEPVKEEAEITRWQCVLTINMIVYQPWFKRESEPQPWNKMNIYTVKTPPEWESDYGQLSIGSPYIVDNSADFGFNTTDNPQLLQSEYEKGWYYVTFSESSPKKYKVVELVNKNTLKLTYVDENGDEQVLSPTANSQVAYKLHWNSIHIDIELPKN